MKQLATDELCALIEDVLRTRRREGRQEHLLALSIVRHTFSRVSGLKGVKIMSKSRRISHTKLTNRITVANAVITAREQKGHASRTKLGEHLAYTLRIRDRHSLLLVTVRGGNGLRRVLLSNEVL
jgi:hypothetical protein